MADLEAAEPSSDDNNFEFTMKHLIANGLGITVDQLDVLVPQLSEEEFNTVRQFLISEDSESEKEAKLVINKYLKNE
jgi:hypothetical protein